jgi:hypothetical protein
VVDRGHRPRPAQTFIRWSRLGVWERLLAMAQEWGVELGMGWRHASSPRWHRRAGAPVGGGGGGKGATPAERDVREALGHSRRCLGRGGYGTVRGMPLTVRDRRRLGPRGRLPRSARSSARGAAGRASAGAPVRCAGVGRGRSQPQQPRLPRPYPGPRRTARHPPQANEAPVACSPWICANRNRVERSEAPPRTGPPEGSGALPRTGPSRRATRRPSRPSSASSASPPPSTGSGANRP